MHDPMIGEDISEYFVEIRIMFCQIEHCISNSLYNRTVITWTVHKDPYINKTMKV